jgi:hypothetical protein
MGETPTTVASGQDTAGSVDEFVVSPPPAGDPTIPSVCAFGLPKSGSVLLQGVLDEMAIATGLTPYSLQQQAWSAGYPITAIPASASEAFKPHGYCFGVFRQMPRSFRIPILETNRSLVLIRDPRDMLVSHYFSMKKSHPRPTGQGPLGKTFDSNRERVSQRDVDTHAIETSDWYLNAFMKMNALFNNDLCKVYRYEDIIFDKQSWVRDIAGHFGWTSLDAKDLDALAARYDIRPEKEDPSQHIRSVTPGDHRNKLKPETIERLNETFKKYMDRFGYDT